MHIIISNTYVYMYIYIYTQTHIHKYCIYIYIYIYIYIRCVLTSVIYAWKQTKEHACVLTCSCVTFFFYPVFHSPPRCQLTLNLFCLTPTFPRSPLTRPLCYIYISTPSPMTQSATSTFIPRSCLHTNPTVTPPPLTPDPSPLHQPDVSKSKPFSVPASIFRHRELVCPRAIGKEIAEHNP